MLNRIVSYLPGQNISASASGARRRLCLSLAAGAALMPMPARLLAHTASRPRIACIDWAAAESLAWLGHMPVAVPDLAVYRQWLPEPPLPRNTIDLGSRGEPNLELLASLNLDRILVSSWQAGMLPLFLKIAPAEAAVVFDSRREPYANIRLLLIRMGRMTGREHAAHACLAVFDDEMERLRGALDDVAHPSVYIAVLHENGAQAFVYGHGSWVDAVVRRLGLRNAWTARTSFYGNSLIGISELAAVPDAMILYLDQGGRTDRAEALLRDSTLWHSLPAVAAKRVAKIPSFYALGGMASALRCARLVADAALAMRKRAR